MYIYKITNIINNKIYIGQTRTTYPVGRWSAHKNKLNNETHKNSHLLAAWKKYGSSTWKFEVIDFAENIQELDNKEIEYIKKYNSANPLFGYNICSGGTNGFVLSASAKLKIGKSSRGRKHKPETIEKLRQWNLGRKMPQKTKTQIKKQSEALKEKWKDLEFHSKMCDIRKKQMTSEIKLKISATKKEQYNLFGATQAKLWPNMIDPNGVLHCNIKDMQKFSIAHNLDPNKMRMVAHQQRKSHRGWKKQT